MSGSTSHKLYGVWIGGKDLGYENDKAYIIRVTIYTGTGLITMIGKNGEYKEYQSLIYFLWDWRHIKKEEK